MARDRTPETASALHRKQKTPAFPQRNRKEGRGWRVWEAGPGASGPASQLACDSKQRINPQILPKTQKKEIPRALAGFHG